MKSGASQIKVLSDKYEKSKEVIIKINGYLQNKVDAMIMILKHLESYKFGTSYKKQDDRERSNSRKRSPKRRKSRSRSYDRKKRSASPLRRHR